MNRAIKYRLYPNKEQSILIDKTIGCARKIYNLIIGNPGITSGNSTHDVDPNTGELDKIGNDGSGGMQEQDQIIKFNSIFTYDDLSFNCEKGELIYERR